jgi:phosphohistidine phosphatase
MFVYLVHHADAVGPEVDAQRPLSERGRLHAEWLAAQARDRKCAPAAIWHSGKLRARQTAEPFLRLCSPFAEFRMVRGLQPEDPPAWLRDELMAESRDVLLVGHMPHIRALAHLLSRGTSDLEPHGLVALERKDGLFESVWRLSS